MDELNGWGSQQATDQHRDFLAQRIVDQNGGTIRSQLVDTVEVFLSPPVSPTALCKFELALMVVVREIGRLMLQAAIQALEPSDQHAMPKNLYFQCGGYLRWCRSDRKPNRSIATRFGNITLLRTGYRSWQRGEETIFPLEIVLGLIENVSPAMLDWIGQAIAASSNASSGRIAGNAANCGRKQRSP